MKPNVKLLDRSKNNFIFFQLGLIAAMVTVLFILEFNFKDATIIKVNKIDMPFQDEEIFVYNPKVEKVSLSEKEPKILNEKLKLNKIYQNDFKQSEIEINDEFVEDNIHNNETFNNDKVINDSAKLVVKDDVFSKDKIYDFTESLPVFPACKGVALDQQKKCFEEQLRKEIYKNLIYPENDLYNEKEGAVFVQFIIDQNGLFTEINPIVNNRGTANMRKAVEVAVKKLPKITPAKHGGEFVKIRYTMPILFKITK